MDAILDAAAALIEEHGIGALTVHGIAARAGTSIGSMYHFFPDLDAVIIGLVDRHLRRFEPLVSALAARDAREWSRMSAAAAADAIITPLFAYPLSHPDILALYASPESASQFGRRMEEMKRVGLDLIDRILAARSPSAPAAIRRARAAVVVGTVEGVAMLLTRSKANQTRVVDELTRAVTAYLEAVDRAS